MRVAAARKQPYAVPTVCSLTAALVAAYLLTLPHFLTGVRSFGPGYDDGVYVGAATLLVHGSLPYRDFTLMHPPGIVLLLSPIAAIGRVVGTSAAMAIARVLMLLIGIANPGLAAFAVRSRGRTAMAVAGATLALWPLAPVAFQTVRLEPPLVLLLLLAACVGFDAHGSPAGRRRLVVAGFLAGLATDIKLVGGAAVVGLLVACLRSRRSMLAAGSGALAAVVAVCGPFFVLAPQRFWHEVVASQVLRHDPHGIGFFERFGLMTGIASPIVQHRWSHVATAVAFAIVIAVVAALVRERRSFGRFEWFAIATAVVLVVGLVSGPDFYDYYAYSTAAVLAPLLGIAAAHYRRRIDVRRTGAIAGVALAAVAALLVVQCVNGKDYLSHTAPVSAAIGAEIPKGASVVTDTTSLLIAADRFPSPAPGCPELLDSIGVFLSQTHTPPETPPYPASLVAIWQQAFAAARYVVLSDPHSRFVPWTPQLEAAFAARFHEVAAIAPQSGEHQFAPGTYIYVADR